MLQFAYPWMFVLLLLPLGIRYLLPAYREPRVAVQVPFLATLQRISGADASSAPALYTRDRLRWLMVILVWASLVTAVARPQWLEDPLLRELPMRDLLVALDLSGSMETRDFTNNSGQMVDRLTAARQALDPFLSRRDGDRVGLIFFGSAAFVQAPFTDDLEVVRELLGEAQVRMLGPRTVLGDAIGVAIQLFERSEVEERVLITLTDGNDTGSLLPPVRAAEIARDNGVTIYPVAMGDPEAAGEQALDEASLKAVAATTGGEFFHAEDRAGLERVYQLLEDLNPRQVEIASYRPQNELFQWPLGISVILSMTWFALTGLALRWGERRKTDTKRAEAS